MLCQKCHKNLSSVRYAEVVDGKVNNLHLCRDCLERQQEQTRSGFELSEPAPYSKRSKSSPTKPVVRTTETCDACETDLQTILKTGKVGCTSCYIKFATDLEALMEGLHVALTHRGKKPHVIEDARARARAELQNKRALMRAALNLENYEEAASLRDDIRHLETGLGTAEAEMD